MMTITLQSQQAGIEDDLLVASQGVTPATSQVALNDANDMDGTSADFATECSTKSQDGNSGPPRPLKPFRFAFGMLLTGCGMALILLVGIRMIEVRQFGGQFAMLMVAITIIAGVMLLGGGFGIMATSSSGFDEEEFDRLVSTGNIATARDLSEQNRSTADDDEPNRITQTHRQG